MLCIFFGRAVRKQCEHRICPERASAADDDAGAGGAPAGDVHGDPGAVREIQAQGSKQFFELFFLHLQDVGAARRGSVLAVFSVAQIAREVARTGQDLEGHHARAELAVYSGVFVKVHLKT